MGDSGRLARSRLVQKALGIQMSLRRSVVVGSEPALASWMRVRSLLGELPGLLA